ncbi:MAG: MarR family transcriptional regulator [Papillibacter sp.]|jgi:DNA-binding MarR family transcriptional regulator|nr:MarR family transcriptional regulator [Papillibacter sp.]
MLHQAITDLYKKIRLSHYRELFGRIREKDGSLSATEAFAADVIYLLGNPTLSQFAEAIGVSQPNATYKANNLAAKGYVVKTLSEDDKRECRLAVSDKFFSYYDTSNAFLTEAVAKLKDVFTEEEMEMVEKLLVTLNDAVK